MSRIITKHIREEPTGYAQRQKTVPTPNTEPLKTKTAQPFSGTAPFSAI
ncbi:hypothetical protein QMK47_10775 [Pseudomonas sp. P9_35]|nr:MULTISPECIES: hypothetical protein [unclassified Pseudomonas]WPN65442.1 hypothetical protein QMK48_09865 [Pseudomonas sp. P9_32]WPN71192.1 hypothetical protein QMK47_10775 [Pseudomonas sp. P9_35]